MKKNSTDNRWVRIYEKYRQLSVVSKTSLWYLVCNIGQKAVTVLTVPIIARLLTTEEYGRYSVLNSWANIFFLFATLSICDDGYMVGIKKYCDDKDGFTSSVCLAALSIMTGTLLCCLLVKDILYKLFGIDYLMLTVIFLYVYGQFGLSLWYQRNRYDFRYKNVVILTLVIALLTPCIEIGLIYFSEKSKLSKDIGANLGYVLPLFLAGIPVMTILLNRGKTYISKKYWEFAIGFNLPLIPYYLSQRILHQSDRIMIERLETAANAGIYSVAYSISNLLSFVNNALNSTFIPWKYRKLGEEKAEEVLRFTNIEIMAVAVLHLILVATVPELIYIFAGEKYSNAIYIVPSVTIGIFCNWVAQQFINIELYYEKTKYTAISSCIAAALNLILNWIFISRYGYIAAGYTTLLCYTIYMITHMAVCDRIIKKRKKRYPYDRKAIILIICMSFLSMVILMLLYSFMLLRYLCVAILGICLFFMKNCLMKKLDAGCR